MNDFLLIFVGFIWICGRKNVSTRTREQRRRYCRSRSCRGLFIWFLAVFVCVGGSIDLEQLKFIFSDSINYFCWCSIVRWWGNQRRPTGFDDVRPKAIVQQGIEMHDVRLRWRPKSLHRKCRFTRGFGNRIHNRNDSQVSDNK